MLMEIMLIFVKRIFTLPSALEDHDKSDLDPSHDHLPKCDLRSRSDHDLTRECDLQIMN